MLIRSAATADAYEVLRLKRRLDQESRFMLVEADERCETVREVADELRLVAESANSTLLVADSAGELIGYVEASGGRYRRNRASAQVVLGVVASWQGQGVGTALLGELDRWTREAGLHRLELTVMAHNEAARRLYRKCGFVEEGRRRECLVVDGSPVDEIYMAKLEPRRP